MLASRTAFLSFLCLLPVFCAGWEDFENYVPYPPEASGILNQTIWKVSEDVPTVSVLATLPGHHLFEAMQNVAVRNSYQNPLFELDVMFLMGNGVDFHCRTHRKGEKPNAIGRYTETWRTKERHRPSYCHNHCTHHGRYCPIFSPEELKERTDHEGKDLVFEVLRRLCIGHSLENGFANATFFKYMEAFETRNCIENGMHLGDCSNSIFEEDIPEFPSGPNSQYAKCVDSEHSESDAKHPILEHSLDVSYKVKNPIDEFPLLDIGHGMFQAANAHSISSNEILEEWCGTFKGLDRPVACDFCVGCRDVQTCLWNLQCDGRSFDVDSYKRNKETELAEAEVIVMDAFAAMLVGGALVFAALGTCWFIMKEKRRRAVKQVAKELPAQGFSDGFTDTDREDSDEDEDAYGNLPEF